MNKGLSPWTAILVSFPFFEFDRWNWQHCLHTKLTPTLNDIRSIIKKISLTISVHTNNKIDIIINYYLQNVPIFSAANNIECHNMKCKYWKCLWEILKAMRLEGKCQFFHLWSYFKCIKNVSWRATYLAEALAFHLDNNLIVLGGNYLRRALFIIERNSSRKVCCRESKYRQER